MASVYIDAFGREREGPSEGQPRRSDRDSQDYDQSRGGRGGSTQDGRDHDHQQRGGRDDRHHYGRGGVGDNIGYGGGRDGRDSRGGDRDRDRRDYRDGDGRGGGHDYRERDYRDDRRNSFERGGEGGHRGYHGGRRDGSSAGRGRGGGHGRGGLSFHSSDSRSHAHAAPKPSRTRGIMPPMLVFKAFVMSLPDDIPPDQYVAKYAVYQQQYMIDLREAFFQASKSEEWFHGMYHPAKLQLEDTDHAVWATGEAEALQQDIVASPAAAIAAMSLYKPRVKRVQKPPAVEGVEESIQADTTSSSAAVVEAADAACTAEGVPSTGDSVADLSGHANRTVIVRYIHASCSKAIFTAALVDALAEAEIELPERVNISQPTWVTLKQFVKTAYVVLHTADEALAAVDVIQKTRFSVPGPMDIDKGEPTQADSFSVETSLYRPRSWQNLPHHHSNSRRVEKDLERAVELAELLDARYDVPAELSLNSLLALPQVMDHCALPTDALDVSICYLRRVHFVAFYAAKSFKNEANMLFELAPTHVRRSPYFVDAEPAPATETSVVPAAEDQMGSTDNTDAVESGAAASVADVGDDADEDAGEDNNDNDEEEGDEEPSSRKRSRQTDDDDDEEEGEGEGEEQQVAAAEAKQIHLPRRGRRRDIPLYDKRIGAALMALKPGSKEHTQYQQEKEDAATLTAAEELVFTALVEKQCPKEGEEGKARCCFAACAKLFKNYDFLKKHLRTRHDLFGLTECLACSESYMKSRFNAQPLYLQPLPPIEVEGPQGIELKSYLDMHTKLQQQRTGNARGQGRQAGRGGDRFEDRRGRGGGDRGGRGGGGGRGSMDRRDNFSSAPPPPPPGEGQGGGGRALSSYMDIDAPKAAAGQAVDYGVAVLPPAKKRKVVKTD